MKRFAIAGLGLLLLAGGTAYAGGEISGCRMPRVPDAYPREQKDFEIVVVTDDTVRWGPALNAGIANMMQYAPAVFADDRITVTHLPAERIAPGMVGAGATVVVATADATVQGRAIEAFDDVVTLEESLFDMMRRGDVPADKLVQVGEHLATFSAMRFYGERAATKRVMRTHHALHAHAFRD